MLEKVKLALQIIMAKFEAAGYPRGNRLLDVPYSQHSSGELVALNPDSHVYCRNEIRQGFRQSQEVGRHVKKGSKALTILTTGLQKKYENEEGDEEILAGLAASIL